jgi:hypothetical protein
MWVYKLTVCVLRSSKADHSSEDKKVWQGVLIEMLRVKTKG